MRKFLKDTEKHFKSGGKYERFYSLFEMVDTFLYTPSSETSKAPFIRDFIDIKRVMMFVIIAMLPTLIFGIYNVGYQINNSYSFINNFKSGIIVVGPIIAVSYAVGGFWEMLFAIVRKHEINEGFLVTGMLIPLIMPPSIPLWMVAVATTFGIVIGKEIFGGTGYNIFNPALLSRAFIFFAYPAAISGEKVWTADGLSQATPLLEISSIQINTNISDYILSYSWNEMFLGLIPGSIGETSTLAILIGAIFLIITGVGSWRIMFGTLFGMVITANITNLFGSMTNTSNSMLMITPLNHFVMGGFAFGMVFMATDPVSASQTNAGRWIYGLLIGFMCIIIRAINPAYPEGMMLGILFANAFAPLIDYYVIEMHAKKRYKRFGT
tara:strand:+ start:14 stop:1156 length:1143 start_codon:yes stop_codon:yes gene_type:complete